MSQPRENPPDPHNKTLRPGEVEATLADLSESEGEISCVYDSFVAEEKTSASPANFSLTGGNSQIPPDFMPVLEESESEAESESDDPDDEQFRLVSPAKDEEPRRKRVKLSFDGEINPDAINLPGKGKSAEAEVIVDEVQLYSAAEEEILASGP